jgi:hypothetical protein
MPQVFTFGEIPARDFSLPFNQVCRNGLPVDAPLPTRIPAAIYYPYNERDHRVPTPNPMHISKGPFPVLLYAHGFRITLQACNSTFPMNRDFTTVDYLLRHLASYGCICVAPDVSWLPGGSPAGSPQTQDAFMLRATVLFEYYQYLYSLNTTLFANQWDLRRLIMVGHSTGGGAATQAGRIISEEFSLESIAYGLIAPIPGSARSDVRNLVVLQGLRDTMQGADPVGAYAVSGLPKTLVTIPGANHFGYTSLCNPDNTPTAGVNDAAGTISRTSQQQAGAAYLAALVRYYALKDGSMRPYLVGTKPIEGLETLSISAQAQGILASPPQATRSPRANP